ncbi:MAG: hypothetical protein SLRJCFUN_001408 [Candidatus Fervidibacter sp.]
MRWLWLTAMLVTAVGAGFAQTARISAIVRVVEFQRSGTTQWLAGKVGTSLENGDRVRTGKRSYAEVTFADRSVVKLNELSELTVHSVAAGKQEMELHQGSLWARFVKGSQATVRAKTTVAAVRGTGIVVSIDPATGSVLVRVLEGELSVTLPTGETIIISAGQEIVVPPVITAPPQPTPAPPPQFGSSPTVTDQPFTEVTVSGVQTSVVAGAPDFPQIQTSDPAQFSTSPSLPNTPVSQVTPPPPPPPTTGNLKVVVRSRQASLETSGIALTSDARPRRLIGARLRPRGTVGPLFYSLAIQPLTDLAGTTRTRFTEGYLAYKDERLGTLRLGRQWISRSPVNANLVGKLLVSDIADALSWEHVVQKFQLTAAYLYDAEPFTAGKRQGGYLRVAYPLRGGTVGLSALKVRGGTMGYALDFSQPVIPNQIDLYGEIGRSSAQRSNYYTVGLYFPGLYQRYDTDLFVEYTKAPRGAANFFSLRVFQTIFPGFRLVLVGSRRGRTATVGSGTDWLVGLIYTTSFSLSGASR